MLKALAKRRRSPSLRPPLLGRRLGGILRHLALDLFNPEIVMLARPIEVHLPGAHGGERALHADGTDIDVSQDDRNHDQGNDGVPKLSQLLLLQQGQQRKERKRIVAKRMQEMLPVVKEPKLSNTARFGCQRSGPKL